VGRASRNKDQSDDCLPLQKMTYTGVVNNKEICPPVETVGLCLLHDSTCIINHPTINAEIEKNILTSQNVNCSQISPVADVILSVSEKAETTSSMSEEHHVSTISVTYLHLFKSKNLYKVRKSWIGRVTLPIF